MLLGFGPHPRELSLERLGRFEFGRFPSIAGGLFAKVFRFGLRRRDRLCQLLLGLVAYFGDLGGQSCIGGGLGFFAGKARRLFALAVCSLAGRGELRGQSLFRLGANSLGFFGESFLVVYLQPGQLGVEGALGVDLGGGQDLIASFLPNLLGARLGFGKQGGPGVFGLLSRTAELCRQLLLALRSEPSELVLEGLFRADLGGILGLAQRRQTLRLGFRFDRFQRGRAGRLCLEADLLDRVFGLLAHLRDRRLQSFVRRCLRLLLGDPCRLLSFTLGSLVGLFEL